MTSDPLLLTCVGTVHDLPLLPHFVAHYRHLGIRPERFRVLLNSTDPRDPGLKTAREILEGAGITHVEDWIAPYTSETMWQARRDLQSRHAGPEDWVLSADVDEFHVYPAPLPEFLSACEAMGVSVVQGVFVDRLAEEGRLAPVEAAPSVLEQFPIEAEVAWSLAGHGTHHGLSGTVKLMAMRGDILPARGGHTPREGQKVSYLYRSAVWQFPEIATPEGRFRLPTQVHHLHWTDSLPQRLERRLATPGVSPAGIEYGQKQLDHFAAYGGVSLDRVAVRPQESGPARPWRAEIARLRRRAWLVKLRNTARRFGI